MRQRRLVRQTLGTYLVGQAYGGLSCILSIVSGDFVTAGIDAYIEAEEEQLGVLVE